MPQIPSAIWHIPHQRNPFFTGRAETLDRLYRALIATGKVALSGLGGIGKTQSAVEYAYRHRSEYEVLLWAKADTEESLKADYTAIASNLNLQEKDEPDKDVVIAAVWRWLEEHSGWLLVLDNADDLGLVSILLRREWGGHILLTTRSYATGAVSKVDVNEMSPEEGTLFLLRRAKLIAIDDPLESATEEDRALAAEITQELGGLPLALDQAGAFIEERPSSLAEYLELYRSEGARLRAERGGVLAADHAPVTITFSLAFKRVAMTSAASADMLRVCAFLAPEAIPEEIFVEGAEELGENFNSIGGGGLNLLEVIGAAARFSLIRRDAKNRAIEIHRLVQEVIRDEMETDTRRLWAERGIRGLCAAFPEVVYKNWPLCEKFFSHAQEAASLIEEYGFKFDEATWLLNSAGFYCDERAQYAEAETLYLQALSIREKILGPAHPDIAVSLNNLASVYGNQGRYAEAESLFARALSIREKTLGPNHLRVALSLNNLASIYDDQGRYAEAEPLYERALSIREKALEPNHPDVATSLNNLGFLYYNQGRYAEAELLYERALSIREKALESDHPSIASSLDNLANLYIWQRRYAEAEQFCRRALSIREKTLGPDHPDVALSLANLGGVFNEQGKYAEAEPLFARALSINERRLDPDHPSVALSLSNLGSLFTDQGRYAEAEQFCRRALSIREKTLGPDHPDVATSLNSLASLYYNQGKYAEAEPPIARALNILESSFGKEHPQLSIVRENYNHLLNILREQTKE